MGVPVVVGTISEGGEGGADVSGFGSWTCGGIRKVCGSDIRGPKLNNLDSTIGFLGGLT